MLRDKAYFISKKKVRVLIAILLLSVFSFLVIITEEESEDTVLSYGIANKLIVVDPGHGGIDSGASRGEAVEKDITLQIGKKLANNLSQAGAMVILLRENESDLAGDEFSGTIRERKQEDMKNRVERANKAQADLFLSVHTNAVPGTEWSGSQTFYKPGSEKSKLIAETIQEELSNILGNTKRKAGAGNYYVLNKVDMPAVLIEVGFISNPQEARLLTDDTYQSKIAYAIFAGVAKSELHENKKEKSTQ